MPNTPVLVRNGASVFACGSATQSEDEVITRRLLEAVGTCDKVPELLMDIITALSGSGPAYVSNNFAGHDYPCVPLAFLNVKHLKVRLCDLLQVGVTFLNTWMSCDFKGVKSE
jgi:hypothetical protein